MTKVSEKLNSVKPSLVFLGLAVVIGGTCVYPRLSRQIFR